MTQPAERNWKIEGREREEWDASALAQLVLGLARARVAARHEPRKRLKSQPPHSEGAAA